MKNKWTNNAKKWIKQQLFCLFIGYKCAIGGFNVTTFVILHLIFQKAISQR
jgi:hypothetical protein